MFVARILSKADFGVLQRLFEVLLFHRPLGIPEYILRRRAISVPFGVFPHVATSVFWVGTWVIIHGFPILQICFFRVCVRERRQ